MIDRLAIAVCSVVFAFTIPTTVTAHEDDHTSASHHAHNVTDIWAMARGGQLYGNWMAVLEADEPTGRWHVGFDHLGH